MKPSGSELPEALNRIDSPVRTVEADSVKLATGDTFNTVSIVIVDCA